MRTTLTALFLLALNTASLAHESRIGNLVIEHPWARQERPAEDEAFGYFKITNTGTEDDRLIGVTLEFLDPAGSIRVLTRNTAILAGETVEFKPGAARILFTNLIRLPEIGEQLRGTLTFEKAGTVEIEYEYTAPEF